jgi:hypothetical protein
MIFIRIDETKQDVQLVDVEANLKSLHEMAMIKSIQQ